MLTFFIPGIPAPGGSKQVFPIWRKDGSCVTNWKGRHEWPVFRVVDDAGKRNTDWKKNVALHSREFMQGAKPFDCALKVELIFFIPRPKNHYRTGKNAHLLKDDAPTHHVHRPDALKLARSTEDAMTGIVWGDDGQNVRLCSEKQYCRADEKPGCAVRIVPIYPT